MFATASRHGRTFYALSQQATYGPAHAQTFVVLDAAPTREHRAAWRDLGNMTKAQARVEYVELLGRYFVSLDQTR